MRCMTVVPDLYLLSAYIRQHFVCRIYCSTSAEQHPVAASLPYSEIYACLAALIHLLKACTAANKFAPHRLLASVTSFLYLQIGDAKTFALHSVSAYICTIIVEDG